MSLPLTSFVFSIPEAGPLPSGVSAVDASSTSVAFGQVSQGAPHKRRAKEVSREMKNTNSRKKVHGCWMCHKSFDRPSTLKKVCRPEFLLFASGRTTSECNLAWIGSFNISSRQYGWCFPEALYCERIRIVPLYPPTSSNHLKRPHIGVCQSLKGCRIGNSINYVMLRGSSLAM